jgi:hypothetical protein
MKDILSAVGTYTVIQAVYVGIIVVGFWLGYQ